MSDVKICSICQRITPIAHYEKHHLKPHSKDKDFVGACSDCADQVHELFTNNELRDIYNSWKIR